MKTNIHPRYVDCNVICGCGATFTTISTKQEVRVEICSSCHPYYTGKQKFVDTAGRVQKFEDRFKWTDDLAGELTAKVPKKPRKARVEKKLPKATIGKGAKKKVAAAQTGPMTEGEQAAPAADDGMDPAAKAAGEAAKAAQGNADADLTPPGVVAAPKDVPPAPAQEG